jgi:hypothetical protein
MMRQISLAACANPEREPLTLKKGKGPLWGAHSRQPNGRKGP